MKIFTTACLVGSFLLCFIYMWLLADAGNHHHTKAQKILALQKMEVTLVLLIFCLVGATFGALKIVKDARKVYSEEAMANMRLLIETTKSEAQKGDGTPHDQ